MPFQDYSDVPAQNTQIGDDIFIGPNMERAKVRPSLQQLAADGRLLRDEMLSGFGGQLPTFTQSGAGAVERQTLYKLRDTVSVLDFIDESLHAAIRAGTDETDLSGAFDDALALGKSVFLPAGRYHANVSLPNGAKLVGEGRELTMVRNFGNTPVFTIDNTATDLRGIQIEGMTISNRDKAVYTSADGIYINGASALDENDYHIFYDLLIFQFRYNVHMKGRSIWNRWVRCSFVEAILDGFFADADDNQAIQFFDTCRWAANGRYGMRVEHTFAGFLLDGWTFINANFENNLWVPIRVGGTFGIQNWTFIGAYGEENATSIPAGSDYATDDVVKSGFLMLDCPYAIGLVFENSTFAGNTGFTDPDYYIWIADTTTNIVGRISSCRGDTAGIIAVYWKTGLDFGLNFGMDANFDRTASSRSAVDSMALTAFTPSVSFSGGNTGITYSNRVGRYVINGRMVTFQAYISLTSKGSSTGTLRLTALPFAAVNVTNLLQTVSVAIGDGSSTKTEIHGQISPGNTYIEIQGIAAGSVASLVDTEVGNFTTFRISGSYLI